MGLSSGVTAPHISPSTRVRFGFGFITSDDRELLLACCLGFTPSWSCLRDHVVLKTEPRLPKCNLLSFLLGCRSRPLRCNTKMVTSFLPCLPG